MAKHKKRNQKRKSSLKRKSVATSRKVAKRRTNKVARKKSSRRAPSQGSNFSMGEILGGTALTRAVDITVDLVISQIAPNGKTLADLGKMTAGGLMAGMKMKNKLLKITGVQLFDQGAEGLTSDFVVPRLRGLLGTNAASTNGSVTTAQVI